MTLREVWDVTEEPIFVDTGKSISFVGSEILLQYEKRSVRRMYVNREHITVILEDEQDD